MSLIHDIATTLRERWPRHAMQLHLQLLPSTMRTAFLLRRFRRLAEIYPEGGQLAAARRALAASRGYTTSDLLRVALNEVLERRPLLVAACIIILAAYLGAAVSRWIA